MKLPHNMVARKWKTAKGGGGSAYYHRSSRETGRKMTALGTDYAAALRRWADLEGAKLEPAKGTVSSIYEKYMLWVDSHSETIAPRTKSDRITYWGGPNDGRLNEAFGHLSINTLPPAFMMQYFEARSSQISAKKELKFLSVLCNWAKARGLMTAPNPTDNIMRHMKVNEKRTIYVEHHWLELVKKHASPMVRDTLEFTYLCANRPDETAQARFTDIDGNELVIFLAKTEGKGNSEKRIPIDAKLKAYIERQKLKPIRSMFLVSDDSGQQIKINNTKFKREFKKARDEAAKEAEATGVSFVRFQLKDVRAKAATDLARSDGIESARLALGHTTQKQTQDYIRSVKHAGENARKRKSN